MRLYRVRLPAELENVRRRKAGLSVKPPPTKPHDGHPAVPWDDFIDLHAQGKRNEALSLYARGRVAPKPSHAR